MAKAPKPGGVRRQATESKSFEITIDDVCAVIRPADYGPRDEVIVRSNTKRAYNEDDPAKGGLGYELSLQGLIAQLADRATIGTDTLATLWWFGRYKSGENIKFGEAVFVEFPNMTELDDRVAIDEVSDDDPADLSPEV